MHSLFYTEYIGSKTLPSELHSEDFFFYRRYNTNGRTYVVTARKDGRYFPKHRKLGTLVIRNIGGSKTIFFKKRKFCDMTDSEIAQVVKISDYLLQIYIDSVEDSN